MNDIRLMERPGGDANMGVGEVTPPKRENFWEHQTAHCTASGCRGGVWAAWRHRPREGLEVCWALGKLSGGCPGVGNGLEARSGESPKVFVYRAGSPKAAGRVGDVKAKTGNQKGGYVERDGSNVCRRYYCRTGPNSLNCTRGTLQAGALD